jgi:hypothetical protein
MSRVGNRLARLALLGAAALGAGQGAGQTPHPGAGPATRERAMTELRARVSDPVEACGSLGLTLEDVLRLCLQALRNLQ